MAKDRTAPPHALEPPKDWTPTQAAPDPILNNPYEEPAQHWVYQKGVAHKNTFVKVLGRGQITKAVKVSAHAVSKSAAQAITAAGGSVTILPLPHKVRPAAKGNQFTNR